LQIPHFQAAFSAPGCCMLHRIALPVVSEWYQQRHSFFTILLTRARIRSTLSTSLTTPPFSLPSTLLALDALYGPQHRRRNGSGIGPSVLSWRALRRRERFRVGEVTFEYRGAALGLPVHRAAYRTGYDAGPKGSRWCLREGHRERHGPGGRRD
jgi:hypothetical protein